MSRKSSYYYNGFLSRKLGVNSMDYNFSITINDKDLSLSPRQGVSMCSLGTLMCDMFGATDPGDGSSCTLYSIMNGGYSPNFVTSSEGRYLKFIDVHRHIHDRGIQDLTAKEAKYARTLKTVLKGGLFLEPYDKNRELITTIYPTEIQQTVQGYYSTTTVYGVVTEIGSPSLTRGTHIYLDGCDYKIFTSREQDDKLRKYYRGSRLALKIRQKRSLSNDKIINATVLTFRAVEHSSLSEGLNALTDEDLNFLGGIDDQESLLKLIGK